MVTIGLALILMTFLGINIECAESVIRKCSKEKMQSWTKHVETFQVLS